jgi:uncharacterized protein (TIGR02594 family)
MRIKLALVLLAIFGAPVLAAEPQMDLRFPAGHMLDSRPFAKPVRAAAKKTGAKLAQKPKAIVRAPVSQAEAIRPRIVQSGPPAGCPARAWCGCWLSKHLGLNDRSLWLARNWARIGSPAGGPAPGVVAVFARGRGGHVGIVTGVPGPGRIILLSGNDGRAVRERERSTRGVIAWRHVGARYAQR